MCIDANASQRRVAQAQWMRKDAEYQSQSLKYWNRETGAQRGIELAATGFSRSTSNDYQRALHVAGQARKTYETAFTKYLRSKGSVDEGGRARRRNTGMTDLIRARGALDNAVANEFGPNMQRRYRARLLKMQSVQAKARQGLGIRPEYGAPVLQAPTDRLTGALDIAGKIVSIASGMGFDGFKAKDAGDTVKDATESTQKTANMSNSILGLPRYNYDISPNSPGGNTNPIDLAWQFDLPSLGDIYS